MLTSHSGVKCAGDCIRGKQAFRTHSRQKTDLFFSQRTELPLLKINTATEKETWRLHVNMKVQSMFAEGRPR